MNFLTYTDATSVSDQCKIYGLIIESFEIDEIEIFVDISISNFNSGHSTSDNMAVSGS